MHANASPDILSFPSLSDARVLHLVNYKTKAFFNIFHPSLCLTVHNILLRDK